MISKPNTCVHCGYERKPHDLAPPWQCPRCKKAYAGNRQVVQKAGAAKRSDASPGLEVEHPYSKPAGWILNGLLLSNKPVLVQLPSLSKWELMAHFPDVFFYVLSAYSFSNSLLHLF